MKLDAVQSAAQAKLDAEMQPVTDCLSRLRAMLDAYEAALRVDVERRVNNTILVALGQEAVPEHAEIEEVRRGLRDSLRAVSDLLEPVATAKASPPKEDWFEVPHTTARAAAPTPAPPAPAEPTFATMLAHGVPPASAPPPQQVAPKPPRKAQPEDIENARRLLAEVEELRKTFLEQHAVRLGPLLQAIAAETRIVLSHLPPEHFYVDELNEVIQTLGRMRTEGGVKDFIKGLAYGSTGPWATIAAGSRRKVERFDKDAEAPPTTTRKAFHATLGDKLKKTLEPAPSSSHTWPELPHLRKLDRPILLAGGMYIPEKVNSIYERFGLKVDWHAIDHNNPKAQGTLIARIRGGKVGVVLILEGFMRHDIFKPIVDVCATAGVPMAYIDKAGVASLATAFDELERKLTPKKEGAA